MEKKKEYTDNRGKLAAMLKKEPDAVPMQEVRPVATKTPSAEEVRINFNVPPEFARKVKTHAAASGKSIKEITMEAYELYFTQLSK